MVHVITERPGDYLERNFKFSLDVNFGKHKILNSFQLVFKLRSSLNKKIIQLTYTHTYDL